MTDLTEAQKEWIAALRSGKYKQGRNSLKSEDGYCCLGVAVDVAGYGDRISSHGNNNLYGFDAVEQKFGFRDSDGGFSETVDYVTESGRSVSARSFVACNDSQRLTFEEIADLAEKNPDKVFQQK